MALGDRERMGQNHQALAAFERAPAGSRAFVYGGLERSQHQLDPVRLTTSPSNQTREGAVSAGTSMFGVRETNSSTSAAGTRDSTSIRRTMRSHVT